MQEHVQAALLRVELILSLRSENCPDGPVFEFDSYLLKPV